MIPGFIKELSRHLPFPLPILSGPGRGLWWKNTTQTLNGYWTGKYESTTQSVLVSLLSSGDTFWDIGAQSGFFSLLAHRLTGSQGHVYSLEPLPQNCHTLKLQRSLNRCNHWKLLEAALWNHSNGISLDIGNAFTSTAHDLSNQKSIVTPSVTLSDLIQSWKAPDLVKVDIEGAEETVFQNLPLNLLPDHTRYIFEIHGSAAREVLCDYARGRNLLWYDLNLNSLDSPPTWGQCLLMPKTG